MEEYTVPQSSGNCLIECASATGVARTDSMPLYNDPRFFLGNVVDKRLAALTQVAVISGLMVDTCMDSVLNGTDKAIALDTVDGWLTLIGLTLLGAVVFGNMMATYVGIAQIYHTSRLVSAGPTGFEMAAGYYLNPNVTWWRHLSVKAMLLSIPYFLIAEGFRLVVLFDVDEGEDVPPTEYPSWQSHIGGFTVLGVLTCCCWCCAGCCGFYMNHKHNEVYRERYAVSSAVEAPLMTFTASLTGKDFGGHV